MIEQIKALINSPDLKDITVDVLEKVLDNQITNEILKEIPLIKSLVSINNVYTSFNDKIFIKKAMCFLN